MEILYLFLIILFILLQGYFAGIETAFISANKIKLKTLSHSKVKNIKRTLKLLDESEKVIGALLIGTNICTVAAASLSSMLFIRKYGEVGEYYATITITLSILIFSEILPKAIFRKLAEPVLISTINFLNFITNIFGPPAELTVGFIKKLPLIQKLKKNRLKTLISREDLKTLFHITAKSGKINEFEKKILERVFDFSATYAREVMVPLIDMYLISKEQKVSDVVKLLEKTGVTKIPVYEGQSFNIVGYVDIYKLFKASPDEPLTKYICKPYYFPETKKIDELFIEMINKNIPVAFIVDEYGGVSGLVTKEDIIEEIVGEIESGRDIEEDIVIEESKNEWVVNGDIDIDDLYEEIGLKLPKSGFETLSGFIQFQLGKIPKRNEYLTYDDYIIKIIKATPRSIEKVKIKKI